jgi:hypothetical protein
MRKAVLIVLALAALRLLPKALQREARALELITLLFQVTLAATARVDKAVSTEQRTAALEVKTGTITTQLAGNTGFANALGYGPTSTANVGTTSGPDAGDLQTGLSTSGQIGGAAAHTHTLPFFLPNANHTHAFGGHTHDFGGHAHPVT